MMSFTDSIDKIVKSYFAVVTKCDFTYKGKKYNAKPLRISPLLLRKVHCFEGCGGCCPVFSLDYLPFETHPEGCSKRIITFNNKNIEVISDKQILNKNHHCSHLDMEVGRCGIHVNNPFTCDFELIRTGVFADINTPNIIGQRLFGRGWNMLRIDGKRGALCTISGPGDANDALNIRNEIIRKLQRLDKWCVHFGIKSHTSDIIKIISNNLLKNQIITLTNIKPNAGFNLVDV